MRPTVTKRPEATIEPLAGLGIEYPTTTDRAVKAPPTGGLWPALTALVSPSGARSARRLAVYLRPPAPGSTKIGPLFKGRSLDRRRFFRDDN